MSEHNLPTPDAWRYRPRGAGSDQWKATADIRDVEVLDSEEWVVEPLYAAQPVLGVAEQDIT